MYEFLSQSDRYRIPELMYSDALAAEIGGKREVVCGAGRIDILTSKEVIEVKRMANYKEAVGQVTLYGTYYPNLGKRIHLIGHPTLEEKENIEIACNRAGVRVTWDEMKIGRYVSPATFLEDHAEQAVSIIEFLRWSAPKRWEVNYLALIFQLESNHCHNLCYAMMHQRKIEIAPWNSMEESRSFYIPLLETEVSRFDKSATRTEIHQSFLHRAK